MSAPSAPARPPQTAHRLDPRWYWAGMLPFLVIFVGSVALTFGDLDATRAETVALGYPAFVVVPQGIAKVAGLVAVLWPRWPLLTGLAFAGFLYDVVLALAAHLVKGDDPGGIALAVAGLAAVVLAFAVHRARFPGGGSTITR
jgi:hypothetical protein